ncbi:pyruvate kinase [Nocardia sp. NBC_01503]|uniref:pyruvate kinase n=1 Tax=Nocardia sp. NBC_01503 TaxID=2975997 RepID=UPI002E7AB956|nr:pyruvate kinase [Nocardia sp. NBC_01503]WTL30707.1 pyruvate kinase [Nocardia sp. NBC_01503]
MNVQRVGAADLADRLDRLRAELVDAAAADAQLRTVHPDNRASAENLAHYVALRRRDVRDLQTDLAIAGLSSLGRSEAHVLASVDAVRMAVAGSSDRVAESPECDPVDFVSGERLLRRNANALLGAARDGRRTRIMVTLPTEAAADTGLVERIVAAGAEVVRVNCAHDGPERWARMIANVRAAARAQGRHVRVTMDLGGPKLRTGPILPGPAVLHLKPERDELGRCVRPVRVWLTSPSGPPAVGAVRVPVRGEPWLRRRKVRERIRFQDARGSARRLVITSVTPDGCYAELGDTAYLVPETELTGAHHDSTVVDELPRRERKLMLCNGDPLLVIADSDPVDANGAPPRIGCTLPEVFRDTRVGQRIFFDDGKIGGVIEAIDPGALRVRITDAPAPGVRLGAAKGINLPDTALRLPALTDADIARLPFVIEHADAVSLSFVRSGADVELLQHHLSELGGTGLGLILKIETVAGFENLPEILLTAMRRPHIGVMIARGDLAVEAGYARLAEVQEEILWLCEAAHVPVIWATQVLDTLARTGRPSRAEVTDAAMSGRAECVMLNKGPYIDHAVAFLDDILTRMAEHQRKKNPLLRQLRSWNETAAGS